jgi:hypothetical protein
MTRRMTILCSIVLAACGGSPDKTATPSSTVSPKVAKAAALAKELKANPDDADAILQRHGMTREQFDELMYEIASDEAMSQAFERERAR